MKKIRVGFIGSGYMGQLAHIANYALLPAVELVALAEGRTKLAEMVANRYGIEKVYPSHRDMLEAADLDAVVAIMNWSFHHAVVPDVLRAGKHLLTEKPICVKAETARELVGLAAKNKVVYHIAYMKRCDPASILAKQTVREWKTSGKYGALKYVRVTFPPGLWQYNIEEPIMTDESIPSYQGETPESFPTWMSEESQKLYDTFVDPYIHQVNLLRYLLDEDYQVEYADPAGITLTALSGSGVICVLEMAPYNVRDHWEEYYKICFEKAWISLDLPAPLERQHAGKIRIYRGHGEHTEFEEPILPPKWSMAEQARLFIESVQGKSPCISPASEAVKDLEVAESYVRVLNEVRRRGSSLEMTYKRNS